MANQQQKSHEIPAEFKIANYKTALWGLKEWAAALTIRSSIRKTWRLVCFEGKHNKDVPDHIMTFVREAASRILSNPSDTNLNVSLFNAKPSYNILPIRDQSPADCFADAYTFEQNHRYLKWVNRAIYIANENYIYGGNNENHVYDDHNEKLAHENQKYYCTPAWEMHKECSELGFVIEIHSLFIAVDLRASDRELKQEFNKWLRKTRKNIGISPKNRIFNDDDFADWHTGRLLQYLDLTFWGQVNNIVYTNDEACKAIFPTGEVDEYHVGRTTRKNALKMISDEYVFALNNQLRLKMKNK